MSGPLLVAHQHVVDRVLGEGVVQVDHGPTRDAKGGVDALTHQALPDCLCSC